MSKPYALNSPHMRRAVLKDLRTVKGWLSGLVSTWSPQQTGAINPTTGGWDPDYRMPTSDLPEHNVKDLVRTIEALESTIVAATTIRDVVEQMLSKILAGGDPDATGP